MAESHREAVEAGDGEALIHALVGALQRGGAVPDWLAYRALAAFRRWMHLKARTLDEAFGVSRPKGRQIATQRHRADRGILVFMDVDQLRAARVPVDEQLFAAVGRLHGFGKTTASEIYYSIGKTSFPRRPDCALEALPPRLRAIADDLTRSRQQTSAKSRNSRKEKPRG